MTRKRSSGKSMQQKSCKSSQQLITKNVEQGSETEKFDYKSHCKIETKTEAQRNAMKLFNKSDYLFLIGPAGVGKSFVATSLAIRETINYNVGRIVLTRPVIEAEETLGFLPGTFEDKINPYLVPLYDQFDEVFEDRSIAKQFEKQFVHIAPLAYMRGRSQPLDAKVMTPIGYRLMGDLRLGDYVIGSDGTPTAIDGIYPQDELDIYCVTFTDGTSVECSGDHLWETTSLYERRYRKCPSVKTTIKIAEHIKCSHTYNHQIPITEAVQFNSINPDVDPYLLGAMLGDGCIHKRASLTITSVDQQILDEVISGLPDGITLKPTKWKNGKCPQYRLTVSDHKQNLLRQQFKDLGLLGVLSPQKFIPEIVKISGINYRLEVLRGLMDTDGCCSHQLKRNPRSDFYSTSEQLARDVAFLVHSLGGTASVHCKNINKTKKHKINNVDVNHNHDVWITHIRMLENPFKLRRKSEKFIPLRPIRAITSVRLVGKKKCQCIKVSAPNRLYLTEHCIVTHNTFNNSICILDEAQNCTYGQMKLYLTRLGKNSKMIITGDPNQCDVKNSGLMDVIKKCSHRSSVGVITFENCDNVRHPAVENMLIDL